MCSSRKILRYAISRANEIASEKTPVYICHIDELDKYEIKNLPPNTYHLSHPRFPLFFNIPRKSHYNYRDNFALKQFEKVKILVYHICPKSG